MCSLKRHTVKCSRKVAQRLLSLGKVAVGWPIQKEDGSVEWSIRGGTHFEIGEVVILSFTSPEGRNIFASDMLGIVSKFPDRQARFIEF